MIAEPGFSISIDRASMAGDLDPLVISGVSGETPLTVVSFTEPAKIAEIDWLPDMPEVSGSTPRAFRYAQAVMGFTVASYDAESETDSRALITELWAAIARLGFPIVLTVADAPDETWSCRPGSLAMGGARDWVDLAYSNPLWSVTIPCYPIPEFGA